MIRTLNYTIDEKNSNKTIYVFLREHFYTAKILAYIKHSENSVILNGKPVFLNTILDTGDTLKIIYSEEDESENIIPVDLPFKIVYEDEDIIVVNKPQDMPVHPAINNFDNTLANGLKYYFDTNGKNFMFRCINRLDRDTSGLLVVAKHRLSASILSDFMKKREIKREYYALVAGIFNNKSGTINAPISRVSESIITRQVDFENGDSAITHYEVLNEFKDISLLRIHLDTGRTHQIRVHMKYIGHPLLGDHLYNEEPGDLERQALHSRKIGFSHPITLEWMDFECEIPDEWNGIISRVLLRNLYK